MQFDKFLFISFDADELNPGGSKPVPFSLYNRGINDTFTLHAETDDSTKVSANVQPASIFLIDGETHEGNITLTADANAADPGTIRYVKENLRNSYLYFVDLRHVMLTPQI